MTMAVPRIVSAPLRTCAFMVVWVLALSVAAVGKGPEPPLRLPLAAMGWQPPTANVIAGGGALTTVHFIDEQHLLVTYNVRRLMKRLPDDPPDDMDRIVEGVVVDLPGGKVLAATHWRVHDAGQYLWGLGQGRFLLRIRDTLTTFTPLANLAQSDPFVEQPFLSSSRQVVAVLLSAERDLLTVETVERPPRALPGDPPATPVSTGQRRTQINFYRIVQPIQPAERVVVQSAGIAVAKGAVNLSLTSAGYIEVSRESASRWLFDFDSYAGKKIELSPFDTSCRPQTIFVSASEFVAFGCRGVTDRVSIGGFNMRGEQMWQQDFTDAHAFPNFAFAPVGGRFALSRNIVSPGAGITVDFAPSAFTMQEIRVYQTYSGKQLLRAEASPVQRTGQNYDLSPQGERLAVVHADAVEVYRLPTPTRQDEAAVRAARALAPEDLKVAVNLAERPTAGVAGEVRQETVAQSPVPVAPVPAPEASQPTLADPAPGVEEPRKKPTLYTLPTDKVNQPEPPH